MIDHAQVARKATPGWRSWFRPAVGSDAADNVSRGMSPWIDLVHLLWAVWIFVIPWVDRGYSRVWLISTVLGLPLFVLLFVISFMQPRRIAYRFAWALHLLSLLMVALNPGAAGVYFMFGCMTLELEHWGRRGIALYVLQLLLMVTIFIVITSLHHYPWQAWLWLATIAIISSNVTQVLKLNARRAAQLRMSEAEVRRLAALAERERIGRDLHDLLGHTLSTITLKLELSRRLQSADAEASSRERDDAESIARQALSEVRAAVTGIRATDIVAELAAARLLLEPAGVRLKIGTLPTDLPASMERALALVIREAVTNIARHALARHAWVDFKLLDDGWQLQIRDDGRGSVTREGNGLSGIRERVAAQGGRVQLSSVAQQGTLLCCYLPLPDPAAASPPAVSEPSP